MAEPIDEFQAVLKRAGYSVTRPRVALFKALTNAEPYPMNELTEQVKGYMDRASVYRGVDIFERLGVVRRINIGWKYKIELSDMFSEHHHHLACLRCQKIFPISENDLENFVETISAKHAFRPLDHQIEIQGYCSACTRAGDDRQA